MALTDLTAQFPRRRLLVLGDVILDHYVRGGVSRTSAEAPVPILAVEADEYLPGGAANVAMNAVAMGARVVLVGLAARDAAGNTLRRLVRATPRLTAHFIASAGVPTILKTRFMAQGQQMLRIDREVVRPLGAEALAETRRVVAPLLDDCDGVILSDYGKGFLTPELIAWVVAESAARGLRVVVDPKGSDYTRYRGASVLTPNQKEAQEAAGVAITDDASLVAAARRLQKMVRGEAVVITRGPAGVSVFPARGAARHLPARAREVFDVTGAGDSFIAAMGLALFSGGTLAESAELGNLAGGIAVGQVGVARVTRAALEAAARDDGSAEARKLRDVGELEDICRSLRHHGARIVFTNGFFDLLHHGHIRLLERARAMGDCLIVALNSDAGTRRLKGPGRPILTIEERAAILAALPFVDYITVFDEDTPERLLRALRPEVLVKGGREGDAIEDIVGHEIVGAYGGEVRYLQLAGEPSISDIIARARGDRPARPKKGRGNG